MQFLRSAAAGQGYHHVGRHNSDSPREVWTEEESEVDRHDSQASDAGEKAERQRAFLKCFSIMTVASSLTAFGIQLYVYNVVFRGRILPAVGKHALALPGGILFNLLWCLAFWSYFNAHSADPGKVPQEWYEFVDRTGEDLLVEAPRMAWQPGRASLCSKCMLPRPERAHHCFVCGMCVLRMDHHCPWINNCIGYKNHKFFLLLGTYACLACYAFVATTLPELMLCAALFADWEGEKHQERRAPSLQASEASVLDPSDAYWLLGACCFAGMAAAALTALLCVHVPLAGQNSTTIEDNYENMPNPFDQGNSLQNLAQVFGEPGLDWFFPVAPRRPLSDGISFLRFGGDVFCHSLPVVPQDQAEADLLWRSRYRVRSRRQPETEQPVQQDDGPVTMLARFLLMRNLSPHCF